MFFNKHIGKPKHLWWMNSGDVLFSCLALCIPKFDAFWSYLMVSSGGFSFGASESCGEIQSSWMQNPLFNDSLDISPQKNMGYLHGETKGWHHMASASSFAGPQFGELLLHHGTRPGRRRRLLGFGGRLVPPQWTSFNICDLLTNLWNIMGISSEYHGNIFGISWEYLRNIMGISWEYLRNIMGISWEYLRNIMGISWEYLRNIMGISWEYLRNIMGISWEYLRNIMGISWEYLRNIMGISWEYLRNIMGISWEYLRNIMGISSEYLRNIMVFLDFLRPKKLGGDVKPS